MNRPSLLICDDDSLFQIHLKRALKDQFESQSAYNGDEAIAILAHKKVDVLVLDIQMRSPDEGLQFIPKLLQIEPELEIVISSSMKDFEAVREAMRLGASDYVVKGGNVDEL